MYKRLERRAFGILKKSLKTSRSSAHLRDGTVIWDLPDGIVGLMPRLVSPSHKKTRTMTTS